MNEKIVKDFDWFIEQIEEQRKEWTKTYNTTKSDYTEGRKDSYEHVMSLVEQVEGYKRSE